uniref:Putative scarecrow-like protein 14 n=1 Tax=Davidia involucrata TaxID=16924 RepID=A0A5B7AQH3_DAVIN
MDPNLTEFYDSMNVFKFDDETGFDQSPKFANDFKFKDDSVDLNFLDTPFLPPDPNPNPNPGDFAPSSSVSSELDSPDDHEFSDTVLKFLNQILVEENIEEKPSMFHDPLALQAAEKSFYDVLGEKYPPSPNRPSLFNQSIESPNDSFFGSSSENSTNSSNTSASNSNDPQWIGDSIEVKSSSSLNQSNPVEYSFQSTTQSSLQWPLNSINNFSNGVNAPVDSFVSTHLAANIFSDSQSILQFKRGMVEASKFLPSSNQLMIDSNYTLPPESKGVAPKVTVKVEKDERGYSANRLSGSKNRCREDSDLEEERSSKQSALYVEESELSEMFDKVLLSHELKGRPPPCRAVNEELQNGASKTLPQNGQLTKSNGEKPHAKKQDNQKMVDLRTLLINCAQSVAADDCRTANEQLKQIRQHSSPFGDGSQRLAQIFANGLEARMAGTGSQIYKGLASKRPSAANMLKAYQLYISASPFKKISIFFANLKILELAEKATKLHIVDFGILYGFQWPILIQRLSIRPGGPPKLRITGIGFPQPGFRPAELVEETGRRLAKYCERFNVPFEYNAIAKKWETIRIEDLKIDSNEFLAVNCLLRFRNLLDETVVVNSPRDAVLNLVRKMNPDIFVHAILNGTYNAPFFVTRFREALFHYSAFFDLFDTNIPREDQERLMFEKEFYGREIMNIIACEGSERVERPETYKQWHIRNMRAGLRPLPLNREVMKKLKTRSKAGYHKDFMIDEDGHWMLQGWKGRILYANSCWVPA